MTEAQAYIIVAPFLLLFLTGLPLIMSVLSGWLMLSKLYPCRSEFQGTKWYFQSFIAREVSYSLTVGANEEAIYLYPSLFFQLWHKPLLIPFDDIEGEELNSFFNEVQFKLKKYPSLTFRASKKLANRFELTTKGCWKYKKLLSNTDSGIQA